MRPPDSHLLTVHLGTPEASVAEGCAVYVGCVLMMWGRFFPRELAVLRSAQSKSPHLSQTHRLCSLKKKRQEKNALCFACVTAPWLLASILYDLADIIA